MDDEKKLLIARVNDAINISTNRNVPKFLGFLTPSQAQIAFANVKNHNLVFYGGYEGAERTILGILPEYLSGDLSIFPITAVVFSFSEKYKVTHRDVLGTLMSCGIERSKIGDILITNNSAFVFMFKDIAEYVSEQITAIGRVGVKNALSDPKDIDNILPKKNTEQVSFTVSSARIDAVVGGLTGFSRSKAALYISEGLVFMDSFTVLKPTKQVAEGSIITVRGVGKFKIIQTGTFSKKGREIIKAEKYK